MTRVTLASSRRRTCPQKFMTIFVEKCNEAWSVTQASEDSEETNFRILS